MNQQQITKKIVEEVELLSLKDLKINCATYLKIMQHLNFHSEGEMNESRKREQLRLMVAKKNINNWKESFSKIIT
jgi:hypothetical protein